MTISPSRQAVNLASELTHVDEHWTPRTVSSFNGHSVLVAKFKGEYKWHHHDNTDDFLLVLSGKVTVRLGDGDVEVGPGEMFVLPVGIEHQPYAAEESEVLLMVPAENMKPSD